MSDKAANVILNKLKDMPPQPVIDEVSPQVEMNPMPLVQDVGLPIIDDYQQNGIDLQSGEFFFLYFETRSNIDERFVNNK